MTARRPAVIAVRAGSGTTHWWGAVCHGGVLLLFVCRGGVLVLFVDTARVAARCQTLRLVLFATSRMLCDQVVWPQRYIDHELIYCR